MAYSKAHTFRSRKFRFSLLCKALAHPARILVIEHLVKSHPKHVSFQELNRLLPLSTPTTSQHLAILRKLHIITCKEIYPYVYYGLNESKPGLIAQLKKMLGLMRTGDNSVHDPGEDIPPRT